MSGDQRKIMALWREMIGDPDHEEEDLSGVWAIRLGETTEDLNLGWYEAIVGRPVTRRGEVVIHPEHEWAACTLDGWDEGLPGPVEAKHVGGREPLQRILDRYRPQVEWQMLVTGSERAALSIIEGTKPPVVRIIESDPAYRAELWRRASAFWACVQTLTPPILETAA